MTIFIYFSKTLHSMFMITVLVDLNNECTFIANNLINLIWLPGERDLLNRNIDLNRAPSESILGASLHPRWPCKVTIKILFLDSGSSRLAWERYRFNAASTCRSLTRCSRKGDSNSSYGICYPLTTRFWRTTSVLEPRCSAGSIWDCFPRL